MTSICIERQTEDSSIVNSVFLPGYLDHSPLQTYVIDLLELRMDKKWYETIHCDFDVVWLCCVGWCQYVIIVCMWWDIGHKHQWCSGNINAFQAFALGSIPGWCNVYNTFRTFLFPQKKRLRCLRHSQKPWVSIILRFTFVFFSLIDSREVYVKGRAGLGGRA